ncbi:hypothetical protein [Methylobacterium planeticum]|uniref:Uncharacterized protein n=1 Tax=Methylobacterium planeticum TaxID=2615211 RepID=A0A6N6MJ51_9HYPH|nr:hypothetical protein [Methylobacterium planeticum]KAB1070045.1 hypothetical protein F6X51_24030 [Methylobacterium planeticum]
MAHTLKIGSLPHAAQAKASESQSSRTRANLVTKFAAALRRGGEARYALQLDLIERTGRAGVV